MTIVKEYTKTSIELLDNLILKNPIIVIKKY